MKKFVTRGGLLLAVLGLFGTVGSLPAATVVWTNTAGGFWSVATNWSPNTVPAAADTAFLTNSGTYTITANASATIANLTVGDTNSTGTQTLAITVGTFTVTNVTSASNGVIFLSAGVLVTSGTANLVGNVNQANGTWQLNTPIAINNYNLTNGELRGANCIITNLYWLAGGLNSDALGNVTTIPTGGTLTIAGAATKGLSYWAGPGRTLNNNGVATWTGGGINGQGGATINNNGTMTLNGDFGFAWAGSGAAPVLNNNGTLTKATGPGAFTLTSTYFNNTGAAVISAGSLALNGCAGTNSGGIYLDGSAFFDFNPSTTYTLGGLLNSPSGDHFRVLGATVNLTTTNVTTPSLFLSSGILNQNTNVAVNTLNQANGTWQLNVPVAINNYNLTNGELRGANCTITNLNWLAGGLNSDALGNVTTIPAGGTLTISGATTKGLSYYVAPGRTLINNGTATWTGGGINGQGGATINNNATMTLNGDFSFAWAGAGAAPVFNNNGTLTKASGAGAFTLSSIIVNNYNTANITSGSLALSSSQFHNFGAVTVSSGTISFASSVGTNSGSLTLGASSFADFNAGSTYTLGGNIVAPTGDSVRIQGAIVILQTTNLTTPSLLLASGQLTQSTNVVVNTLNHGTGTWQLNVPVVLNNYNLTNGELRGANCTISNFNWLGGSMNADTFGNTTTIPVGGTLTISGATAKALSSYAGSGRALINNGTTTWSGAGIAGYYGPQLVNNNSLTISSDLGYAWGGLGGSPIFLNNGTTILATGADFTLTTVNYFNNGGIYFNSGSLTFVSCAGTNAGLLSLDASSFANFDGGTLRLDGNLVSPAGDHLRFRGMTVDLVTTNITTPSLLLSSGQLNQNTNVAVNTMNHSTGTWQLNVPVVLNNYNLTNGELRGANCTITNVNWLGGGFNSDALGNTTTIPSGGTLTISGATAKSLSAYAGTGRALINNGTATWSGAGISGNFGPQLVNNNNLTITSDLSYVWAGVGNGPIFLNNGTTTLASGTDFALSSVNYFNTGGIYFNTGSLTFTGCAGTNAGLLSLDASSFVNFDSGTLRLDGNLVSPAGDHFRFRGMTVDLVTTNITTPSLLLASGQLNQNTNVAVNTMNHSTGTWQLNVPVVLNNYNLTNGELRGANCTITNLNWLGGGFNSDALGNTTTIPSGGTLTISGATAKSLSAYAGTGRALINNGTATWSGAGISGNFGPQLVNNNTLTITSDLSYVWAGVGNGPVFINNGTTTLASGTDLGLTSVNYFNNGGIYLNTGSLTFTSCGGTNAGLLNLDASSFVNFDSGTLRLDGNLVSPAGDHFRVRGMTVDLGTTNITTPSLLLASGQLNQNTNIAVSTMNQASGIWRLNQSVALNNYNFTNGELRGANLTITNFNWQGGGMNSENAGSNTVSVATGGTLTIASATAKGLSDYSGVSGRRLVNHGTGTWSGAGISCSYGSIISNLATLTMTGDSGMAWSGYGNAPVFQNTGNFTKSGGTGTASFTSTIVTNSGTFAINNGSLAIAGANFTQTAGSANLGTNFSVGANVRIEAGTFAGGGSVAGTFDNNGSTSPGASPGLIVGTSFTNTPSGTVRFEIGGSNPGTNFDQFRLSGAAVLDGTADVSLANGFVPVPGNTFTVMVCAARSGVFTNLTFSGGYLFTSLYTPTSVVLRAENKLPTVTISVVNGNTQLVCTPFDLTATASDIDGAVTNFTLFQGTNVLGSSSGTALSARAESDFPTPFVFSARAIDDQGGISWATQAVTMSTSPQLVLQLGGIRSNTTFKLCMLGEAGSNYMVLAATNTRTPLSNWTQLGLMESTNGIWRYFDSGAITNLPRRYYRALAQ